MRFLLFAICNQETSSIAERIEYDKNFLNSALVCSVEPSAIFKAIESLALLI